MSEALTVPSFGESITEVAIEEWLVAEGEAVEQDTPIVSLESDKATLELPAPKRCIVRRFLKKVGEFAAVGETIAELEYVEDSHPVTTARGPSTPTAAPGVAADSREVLAGPAARSLMARHSIDPTQVAGSGPKGRVLKEDVIAHVDSAAPPEPQISSGTPASTAAVTKPTPSIAHRPPVTTDRAERVVPMSPIRRVIARRLVQATQQTAMLTTFNEIDMSRVMALRKQFQTEFQARYGVKLGFMSFFVKAAIAALRERPAVNAQVREDSIVYRDYYDVGVAVGGGKGLTVPIIRSAERLSFSEIELTIRDFAERAQINKLKLDELQGGTFTISNGGVYGSLLSTPILNPPQSGILGMHKIEKRAVVVDDEIVVRPMMYVALTYDHRIVDGREAVAFLIRVKACIEASERLLLEV